MLFLKTVETLKSRKIDLDFLKRRTMFFNMQQGLPISKTRVFSKDALVELHLGSQLGNIRCAWAGIPSRIPTAWGDHL